MNTQEDDLNQEEHLNQEKAWDKEKIWEMEEEIEFLREQVDSLKQVLSHEYKLSNEYIQELAYTRQELEMMNDEISHLITSNKQSIDETNKLDKSRVKKKFISESITEEFSYSARSPVKVNGSEGTDDSIVRSRWDKSKAQFRELRKQSAQIITRSTQITAQSNKITNRSREITVHSQEVRNRFVKSKVVRDAS